MLWREVMATTGAKTDTYIAGGGAAAGSIYAAFENMTLASFTIFFGVALIVFGRAALLWLRFYREWRHRGTPPPQD